MILSKHETLDHAAVTSLLDYEPDTGLLRWKVRSPRAKIGAIAGTMTSDGYIAVTIKGRKYPAHRLAWFYVHGTWPEHLLDHINGSPCDNRLDNLRPATYSENQANRKRNRNNRSGFTGVFFVPTKHRWVASIGGWKNRTRLGYFTTPHKAAQAYAQAAVSRWGNRCRPDVIELAKCGALV